jgi:hypothetical protein
MCVKRLLCKGQAFLFMQCVHYKNKAVLPLLFNE